MKLPFRIPERVVDALVRYSAKHEYYHLEGYMRRHWVFRLGPRHKSSRYGMSSTGWLSARIHHILRSDDDRSLHDHPQDYCSIILRGGYREFRPSPTGEVGVWHGPGSILFRRATNPHRLEILPGEIAVTLFIMGPRRREWGFHTPNGWVPMEAVRGNDCERRDPARVANAVRVERPR